MAELPAEDLDCVDAVAEDGPLYSINLLILATYFMLGEVEASLTLARHVTLDKVRLTVTFKLPGSKTDVRSLTCSRTC